ncbi:hypothetical protein SFR_6030 [Streptomyces sp. FR-008]|nr:hypothetical protein SFR_6030 [Streptomyces sp. FR-008]
MFLLVHGDDPAVPVEDDAAARRGPLVDRGDERACGVCVGHGVLLLSEVRCGSVRAARAVCGPPGPAGQANASW